MDKNQNKECGKASERLCSGALLCYDDEQAGQKETGSEQKCEDKGRRDRWSVNGKRRLRHIRTNSGQTENPGRPWWTYLQANCEIVPLHDEKADEAVIGNVMENEQFRQKSKNGERPRPVAFSLERDGERRWTGIDLASGLYLVEDEEALWDELCAFQGLGEAHWKNCYCVYEYIACLKKQGRLEEVLRSFAKAHHGMNGVCCKM